MFSKIHVFSRAPNTGASTNNGQTVKHTKTSEWRDSLVLTQLWFAWPPWLKKNVPRNMPTKGWLFMVMHSVEEIWLTSWDGYPMIYRLTRPIIFRHPYQQIQVMFFNASLHTSRVCDRCPAIAAMVLMIEGVAIVLGRNGKSQNGRRVQRVSNDGCSRMTCHVICRKLISCCKHLRSYSYLLFITSFANKLKCSL